MPVGLMPAWSPDGRKIACSSFRNGDWDVYVMNADGPGQTNLTQSPADDYSPDWQAQAAQAHRPPACSAPVADSRPNPAPSKSSPYCRRRRAAIRCVVAGRAVGRSSTGRTWRRANQARW